MKKIYLSTRKSDVLDYKKIQEAEQKFLEIECKFLVTTHFIMYNDDTKYIFTDYFPGSFSQRKFYVKRWRKSDGKSKAKYN